MIKDINRTTRKTATLFNASRYKDIDSIINNLNYRLLEKVTVIDVVKKFITSIEGSLISFKANVNKAELKKVTRCIGGYDHRIEITVDLSAEYYIKDNEYIVKQDSKIKELCERVGKHLKLDGVVIKDLRMFSHEGMRVIAQYFGSGEGGIIFYEELPSDVKKEVEQVLTKKYKDKRMKLR